MSEPELQTSGAGSDNGGVAVATGAAGREYSDEIKALGDKMASLSSKSARSILEYLESEYGIEMPPDAPPVPDKGDTIIVDGIEEKTSFDVHLVSVADPAKRIGVIKIVREVAGLGLAESKALVDSLPKLLKEIVPKAEAEALQKKLEEAGAKVELK